MSSESLPQALAVDEQDESAVERWERRFELPVLIAALLVVPVIVVEQASPGEPWTRTANVLNWAIWLVFALELTTILVVSHDRRAWLRRHPLELAVVVLTPPFLPASLQAARVLRLLRLVRLVLLFAILRKLFSLEGLRYAALVAVLTALGGGAAFAAVEGVSTWDGVYWAVTTMSTVGYGDVAPVTNAGRVIAIAVMVIGIGFLSILIGAAAERFFATEVEEAEEELGGELDDLETDVLRELAEISERLRRIEAKVRQLGSS